MGPCYSKKKSGAQLSKNKSITPGDRETPDLSTNCSLETIKFEGSPLLSDPVRLQFDEDFDMTY